jgi:hypothetical protein
LLCGGTRNAANFEFGTAATPNNWKLRFGYQYSSGLYEGVVAPTFALTGNEVAFYGVVRNGANVRFWKNLSYEDATLTNNNNIVFDTTPGTYLGYYQPLFYADIRVYNRALSDDEILQVQDPAAGWDLFLLSASRIYFDTAAAAAAFAAYAESVATAEGDITTATGGTVDTWRKRASLLSVARPWDIYMPQPD